MNALNLVWHVTLNAEGSNTPHRITLDRSEHQQTRRRAQEVRACHRGAGRRGVAVPPASAALCGIERPS